MHRVRLTIAHNPDDPIDDLRCAANLQRDLWAHSPVEIDPGSEMHSARRDTDRHAFFEFTTDYLPEVHRVLREFGYDGRVKVEILEEGNGTECINCGHIPPELEAVCSKCGFRDIEPCPYCNNEIARLAYIPVRAEVFRCPMCHHKVRFQFHEPLSDANGKYNQPLVLVSAAEATVGHDV